MSALLLQNYLQTNSLWVCAIKVCSNGSSTYISELIAKDKLKVANLMQSFKNLLLQNYSTEFLDTAHKWSLGIKNFYLYSVLQSVRKCFTLYPCDKLYIIIIIIMQKTKKRINNNINM